MPLQRLSQRGSGATTPIGSMNRQIAIQTRAGTNSYNQPGGAWSNFIVGIWARLEHLAGKEVVNQAEYAAEVTDKWTLPYIAGVEPRMRIAYVDLAGKTHYYDILFVQNVEERGFFTEVLAKEIYSTT